MTAHRPDDPQDDPLGALRRRARVLDRLLDGGGRVSRWPKRQSERVLVLEYLVEFVPEDTPLTERQLNDLLTARHTFNDAALLRRQLVDRGFLERHRDGSAYWKPPAG